MFNVWRGQGRLFAECSDCGSYGTTVAPPKRKLSREVQAAYDNHAKHMMALRDAFTGAANKIVSEIREKKTERREGAAKIGELQKHFYGQIILASERLPQPGQTVAEYVDTCPWCSKPVGEVIVQTLDEKLTEPDFTLAKPVRSFLEKQMAKGGK